MTRARLRSRRTVAAGSALLLAVLGGSLAAPAHAAPVTPRVVPDCPQTVPVGSVTTGMVGQGLTVVTGTTPSPFKVEVLGVMKNGIGAGRDLIMIKVSDLPGEHVIDQGAGIWAGMSGSPVYVDGKLLGAVSYGFTLAPSPIGGLTPAADMAPLLDLGGAAARRPAQQTNARLKLSTAARKQLAAKAGTSTPKGTLQPIVTPLGVSGLSSGRVDRLQSDLTSAGRTYKAYAAGGHSGSAAGGTPTERPEAGGNFSYSISSGDVDAFGTGTTTLVCGDQALAFGHPIDLAGPVSYTANNADSLAIVQDNTFGSFKMANLGAPIGTLDQDRTEGVRADLTKTPDTTTVTTVTENRDTRASRTGTTQVSDPKSLSGLLPYIVFAGQDAVFDEWNDGIASSNWTISGTRAGGKPFSLSRANSWASRDDVTISPAIDVASAVDQLVNNDYEAVTIDNISFASTMKTKYRQRHITVMSVSVNGGKFTQAKRLNLQVGDTLKIHVGMKEYRGTGTHFLTLGMTVPKKARGQVASLSVIGGAALSDFGDFDEEGCLFDDECGDSDSANGSLNKVISSIKSAPRNNAVVAELSYDDDDEGSTVTAAKTSKLDTLTVTGGRDILVRVR
ncbi:SpoIVB peptidase S55 domain-containing protein [uncultured Friedmanniella sp.]|uniref:SpoIVB peptidase S55 domain-containing protein n=1 Tax=uncultured Friedmanniella sp. TaxID=335381 RepID=UPI0035CA6ACF